MCLVCPLDVFRLLSKCASRSISSGNLLLLKTISELIFVYFYINSSSFLSAFRAFAPLLFHSIFSYHIVFFVLFRVLFLRICTVLCLTCVFVLATLIGTATPAR